jgi:hypothetical protein
MPPTSSPVGDAAVTLADRDLRQSDNRGMESPSPAVAPPDSVAMRVPHAPPAFASITAGGHRAPMAGEPGDGPGGPAATASPIPPPWPGSSWHVSAPGDPRHWPVLERTCWSAYRTSRGPTATDRSAARTRGGKTLSGWQYHEALATLSVFYKSQDLTPEEHRFSGLLDPLAGRVIYSRCRRPAPGPAQ